MMSPKLYGLQSHDGPMVYVGCTTKPLQSRLNEHWLSVKGNYSPDRPLNKWMRSVCGVSPVEIIELASIQDRSDHGFFSSLRDMKWKFEAAAIAHIARRTLQGFGIVTCNSRHNPFRHSLDGELNEVAIENFLALHGKSVSDWISAESSAAQLQEPAPC